MIIIKTYCLEDRADIFFVRGSETGYCPICGEVLTVRGRRARIMTDGKGDKVKLLIRRLRCEKCGRIHHELPDCIVPYKRHCAETVEAVIKNRTERAPCNNETIRRIRMWWKIVEEYYLRVLKSLEEKYKLQFGKPPEFREIIRASANSGNWIVRWKKLHPNGIG